MQGDQEMTDNDKEIVRTLKNHIEAEDCVTCESFGKCDEFLLTKNTLDLINRQRAEIERLHDEVSKTRRKALLEASSKFTGHSDYHGDTILCKLICMAEGKEVGIAKPLDTGEIKFEAIKEFAKRLKEDISDCHIVSDGEYVGYDWEDIMHYIDNLLKEMGAIRNDE